MTGFITSAIGLLVTATAISAAALPSFLDLTSTKTGLPSTLLWNNLMYANSSAYIGNVKYSVDSQPLLLSAGGGGLSFTSFHSSPTGWQNAYVFPNSSEPLGFTVPHSAAIPEGAAVSGFEGATDANGTDTFLAWNGQQLWAACEAEDAANEGTWQIVWDGTGDAVGSRGCATVALKVGTQTDCRLPSG